MNQVIGPGWADGGSYHMIEFTQTLLERRAGRPCQRPSSHAANGRVLLLLPTAMFSCCCQRLPTAADGCQRTAVLSCCCAACHSLLEVAYASSTTALSLVGLGQQEGCLGRLLGGCRGEQVSHDILRHALTHFVLNCPGGETGIEWVDALQGEWVPPGCLRKALFLKPAGVTGLNSTELTPPGTHPAHAHSWIDH